MNTCPSGWTDPEEIALRQYPSGDPITADELPTGATVEPWTDEDTAELAAAMRDAGHAQRERWSEAVRGGRVLRFFATDPKYAALPLADRVKYAQDVARASWSLLYLR